jgi:hypothetical protein
MRLATLGLKASGASRQGGLASVHKNIVMHALQNLPEESKVRVS